MARALEIASGKTYAQLLEEFVFKPAGITDSVDFDGGMVNKLCHSEDHPNPNKNIEEFLGKYKRNDGAETDVVLRNGFLYSAGIKLYPTRVDCFFEYRFFGDACFMRDDSGKIKEIKWKGHNFDLTWVKQ